MEAEKSLATALADNNGPDILQSLIEYYLAETQISTDNASTAIHRIDSIARATDDRVLRAMLLTLEADIYVSIYTSDPWKYNFRTLPLLPLPDDYKQWSGDQFRYKLNNLLDSAFLSKDRLLDTPIKTYEKSLSLGKTVTAQRETQTYYPTVYDFIANKTIEILNQSGYANTLLSFGFLTPHNLYVSLPFNKYNPPVDRILGIYADLLNFHKPGSAPFVIADLNRLDFVTSHVWDGDNSDIKSPAAQKWELQQNLYNECRTTEYSGDILLAMQRSSIAQKKWLHSAIKHNLTAFPSFRRNNNLKNLLSEIEMQGVEMSYPDVVAPGSDVKFKISVSNTKSGKLYIYNVSNTPVAEQSYNCVGLPSLTPVAVIPFKASAESTVPFDETLTVNHKFETPGQYVAIATIDGAPRKERRWYNKIYVTRYSIAASSFDKIDIWALDANDGAPVEGAKVSVTNENRRSSSLLGITDANGNISCNRTGNILLSKDGDRFARPIWVYISNRKRNSPEWRTAASGFSSLPLYHPGDSVEWMAICYEYKGNEHRPLVNKEISAVLRGANYVGIDTLKATTDSYGRVSGTFTIPKDVLTGRFNISIINTGDVSFMVSDYKLPTFKVILEPAENDIPAKGDVTLRGRVETYAGFPVADAKITLSLSALQPMRWWWSPSNPIKFQTIDATTDSEGNINIVLPKSTLGLSPIPGGMFSAEVSVTSPSGESQQTSALFSTGMRYAIRTSVPGNIDNSAPTTAIKVEVVDYRDSVVSIPVNFAVMRDSLTVLKGSVLPGKPAIDLTSVKSGRYELVFSLADSTLASPVTQHTTLYRPTDSGTPRPDELLWFPKSALTADAVSGEAEWLYAVDCPTNLLVSLYTSDKLISQYWVKAPEGMNRLKLALPSDVESATANVSVTGKYRNQSARLTVKRDVKAKSLKFVTETFRDRTVPGSEETWTFRVIDQSARGRQAAVVMDMYNTALDALAKTDWNFVPAVSWGGGYSFRWNQLRLDSSDNQSVYYRPGRVLAENNLVNPSFDTYGLDLYNSRNRILYRAARGITTLSAVDEHKEEIMVEEALYDVAAPMMAGAANDMSKKEMADAGRIEEETAEAETDAADNSSAGNVSAGNEPKFSFRDREVPLAFFKPMLTTDAEGRLSLTFTVPNANTTWGLRAVAFTDSLLSTSFAAEVTASKPVMVQPNLPRFMRAGDTARVEASVMNGSDETRTIETVIEIFDAADGKILNSLSHSDEISANSAVTIGLDIVAPTDAPFIGYRIKSTSDNFADGEQTLLPVLPAVQPVIDSYPFYLSPDLDDFTMELPVTPKDARITLQYCDNPTWYVVSALPGLLDIEASTANEAGASIFSAAVASGLLRDNPSIAAALEEWQTSEKSDGMLTSMLERNADLKQVLLAATPWMLDARNDTERMNRLSLLFDKKTVESTINANIATLRKLQRNGGGWAWYSSNDEASRWATENLLLMFGRLRELGFMPESGELRRMITSAVRWTDAETKKDFKKYPDSDYTLYVYLRGFFKGMADIPAADSRIVNKTVQQILSDWKSASVFDKAIYARILDANSYPSVARTILSSLREYSDYNPAKGMWWPSLDNMTLWSMGKIGTTALILDAFAAIEPDCQDIDRIRQWLILQKEAKDWGTSVTTTSVVASILSTSRKWIAPASEAKVSVGGKEIRPTSVERLTGSFRSQVDLKPGKNSQLKVSRKGKDLAPAWGSMMYLYTDSMSSVKAASCPDLSVDKQLVIIDGMKAENAADTMTVGQRVKVTLTVKVDRDMDYVTIVDERPACFEPVEQMPTPIFAEGIYFYRENRDSSTRMFINHLPKGVYVLNYEMWVNNAGSFASGIATVQSHYAPQLTAHSAGSRLAVTPSR